MILLIGFAATALGNVTAPSTAAAVPELCANAMTQSWPHAVRLPSKAAPVIELAPLGRPPSIKAPNSAPQLDEGAADLDKLEQHCRDQPGVLQDIASLRADIAVAQHNGKTAWEQLARFETLPESRLYARNLWIRQSAALLLNDHEKFTAARLALVDANEKAMLAHGQLVKVDAGSSNTVDYRAYAPKNGTKAWIFVIVPKTDDQITTVLARPSEYSSPEVPLFELARIDCNSEGYIDPGNFKVNLAPAFVAVRDQVLGYFDGKVGRFANDESGPFSPPTAKCLLTEKVLPGLGATYQFDGTEYLDPAAPLTSEVIAVWLASEEKKKRNDAVNYVLAHPDAVEPFGYVTVITSLLERGNVQQAAFWYYFFQIRSAPWRKADLDPSGSRALFGSIAATLGAGINEWAGSDFDAMRELTLRAIAFERKAPLFAGRPEGVSQEKWQSLVTSTRKERDESAFLKNLPKKDQFEMLRKQNGLYVGPWESPGDPLPDSWR